MPLTLLHLSDEIIQHIAYYVHLDNEIPLPSFNPHWANFKDEIDPANQKDYISFRSTCKRIRELCPLRGLNVVMKSWVKLLKWSVEAPVAVMEAVRRMVIDIDRLDLPKGEALAKYSIVPIWHTLTSFLRSLHNIQELIIRKTPLCQHGPAILTPSAIYGLEGMYFLPKVESISFETRCRLCCNQVPKLFVPAINHLEHLKVSPSKSRQELYGTKKARLIKTDNNFYENIHTLHLKTFVLVDRLEVLDQISKNCPSIHNLYLTAYDADDNYVVGSCTIFCHQSLTTGEWSFKMNAESYLDYFEQADPVNEWGSDQTFDTFLEVISRFEYLEELDCLIDFKLKGRTLDPVYPSDSKKSEYYQYRSSLLSSKTKSADEGDVDEKSKSAMIAAAKLFAATVPTLRVGYFWAYIPQHPLFEKGFWRRWRWTCKRGENEVSVELNDLPEEFKDSWMNNDNGPRDWDYVAQQGEDEDD
ncbi:hypothetical protein L486_00987 [Kwoniella mangroviensis CBS 10435]|uniref:Uncharacterized protein n=1 Tax=Kwoniella mangroviensis CBS 10435 TaxID=1331196 RepID=A0A1B9J0M9_9TREE|nr:hypothetical protein L486_00987 [Kwoniella mangroviensis CBS 10435]